MLSSHMFSTGERSFLQEKVNLLQEQLHEYKQKQSKLNKLNESILQTYKQNEHYRQSREQKLQKQNRQLTLKHRQEIRKLKNQHNKQKSQLQTSNTTLNQKLHKTQSLLQQTKLQHEQQLLQLKTSLENSHAKQIHQIQKDQAQKLEELTLRLQEMNQVNQMYKEYIERKQYQFQNPPRSQSTFKTQQMQKGYDNRQIQNKQNTYFGDKQTSSYPNKYSVGIQLNFRDEVNFNHQIYEMKESNIAAKKVAKQSKKIISELNTRINRAMREIHDDKKISRF